MEKKTRKKSNIAKFTYIGIALVVIIFIGSLFATTVMLHKDTEKSNDSKDYIELPNFTGKTSEEVKKECENKGIRYQIEEEYNNDVKKGLITSQEPAPNTKYNSSKDNPLKLVVSKGAKYVK